MTGNPSVDPDCKRVRTEAEANLAGLKRERYGTWFTTPFTPGIGKAHQMVKVGTKKKRSKQQLEQVKAEEL